MPGEDIVGATARRAKSFPKTTCAVIPLSLTRPAVARAFLALTDHDRTHLFVGARIASGFAACVHLRHPKLLSPLRSSTWCCPPFISSITNDHDEFFDLPFEGGGWPNQSAGDFRTITGFWHPRTGITTFCCICPRRQNSLYSI